MQSSKPSEYLKELKIQQYYLKKFYYNSASEWLKHDIELCLNAIDSEIKKYECFIAELKFKEELRKQQQISIYDMGV